MQKPLPPRPQSVGGAKAFGCNAGIVITASHNPPSYNGFKIKAHFGGPASPAMIKAVEDEMADLEEYTFKSFSTLVDEGVIVMRDVASEYLDLLREKLDIQAI